ncbi:MAG TPA: HAMP domain-containing histidine kinase [Candidatus Blautia merdavium]|uniref:histidine kinase n=1 Tax=Candidatus Blautia merdavium TaxID=2838494 RepID=A0A9D2PPY5_9FIRM|nr:HAMP domain-containing histidine kinase [Candidatus Blautia merdavium]
MDIKWKNTIKTAGAFIKKEWRWILGGLLLAAGLFCLYILIAYRTYHPTEEALFFGVLSNLLLGPGFYLLLGVLLERKYRNWIPQDENFYTQWKENARKLEKRFRRTGAAALVLAAWFLNYVIGNPWGRGWYYNYAAGYLAVITVMIQFIFCQTALVRFMEQKLEQLMERMAQINRESLKKALEIEKSSLEKVSRSDQLRVDLITNVSHDLKTPLTSMVGYLELLKKEELSPVAQDYAEVITDKAEKLKEMIESLFSLAKASSGNIELHMERFEVNRLVEQIFADLEDKVKASRLQFVLQLTEENTELVSDNLYFYRICQNLLENALKYSADGTRVFVKTYIREDGDFQPRSSLCMEITNTAGYYMDFEKEDIIERFARGDKSRSTEGNGLGLAIVSSYAAALGGKFDIDIDCDQFKARLEFPRETIS